MSYFAKQLKNLRLKQGLSMDTLALESNVSKSMICKIERDEAQPTLDVAARLAKALGKTLSEMLHVTQANQAIFLSKNEQAIWEDAQGIRRRNISPVFEGLKIEWLQVEFPPNTAITKNLASLDKSSGEKYVLVTKGALQVKVNEEIFQLKKGDSLYFDSSAVHEVKNAGKDTAEFYIVIKHPNG